MTQASRRSRRTSGITLLEVMIAGIVLVIALFGLMFVITYSSRQNQIDREVQIAQRAAQSVIEAMSSKPYNEIFKMFNDYQPDMASPMGYDPADPDDQGLERFLAKAQPGSWFDVELQDLGDDETLATAKRSLKLAPPKIGEDPAMPGFARPHCGKIIFPGDVLEVDGDGEKLLESAADSWTTQYWNKILGMKLDIDGNGVTNEDVDMASPPDTGIAKVRYKLLPVIVEVKWKGTAGVQSVVLHTFIFDRYNQWMTSE